MGREQVVAFTAGVIVTLLVLWGASWLRSERTSPPAPSVARGEPSASPWPARPTSTAIPAVVAPPRGFRLAGVAENAGQLFAVVELPDGQHGLYRRGEEVPGLGSVRTIGGEKAVFDTPAGELTLWVAPAPTVTRTATRRVATFTPARSPERSPTAAVRSTPESSSSGARGRPVS